MNYEEKIKELEERISKLERIEKNRKTKRIVKIVFELIIVVLVIIGLIKLYNYVKPYFNDIKAISGVSDKINEGEDSLKSYFDSITY